MAAARTDFHGDMGSRKVDLDDARDEEHREYRRSGRPVMLFGSLIIHRLFIVLAAMTAYAVLRLRTTLMSRLTELRSLLQSPEVDLPNCSLSVPGLALRKSTGAIRNPDALTATPVPGDGFTGS